jgi:hypothetical protein
MAGACLATYYGLCAVVILVDRKLVSSKMKRLGGVDSADRSLRTHLRSRWPLALYYGVTWQTSLGWLFGFCLHVAVAAVTFGVAFGLNALLRPLFMH